MNVRVQYFAQVREIAGIKEETLDLPEGTTADELLQELCERHGKEFEEYILDRATGHPKLFLQFMLDTEPLSSLGGLQAKLKDGSSFAIIPPVGGG